MAKLDDFKPGMKVRIDKVGYPDNPHHAWFVGKVGTVKKIVKSRRYVEAEYPSEYGGMTTYGSYPENLTIVNSVLNAKFKVGDTIEWYGKRYKVVGIIESEMRINEIDPIGKLKRDGDYVISVSDTHAKHVVNSNSALNAKFKVGDKAIIKESGEKVRVMGQKSGGFYTVSYLDGRMCGDFSEDALVAANTYRLAGDNEIVTLATTNAVVRNALNAKTIDKWAFEIMLRSKIGDMGKGAEDYMRKNRSVITKDVGAEGFRKLCSKFGNTLAYNAIATTNAVDAGGETISRGDIVIYEDEEDDDNPTEFRVTGVSGDYVYLSNGNHAYGRDLLIYNSIRRSSNAVVRNALAWRARNEIKVGDIVISKGQHRKVVKVDPAITAGGKIAISAFYTLDDGTRTQHVLPVK